MAEGISFGAQKGGDDSVDPHEAFRQNQQAQTAVNLEVLQQNADRIDKALAGVLNGSEKGLGIISNSPTKMQNTAHPGPLEDLWSAVFRTAEGENVSSGELQSGLSALQIFLHNRYGGKLEASQQPDSSYMGAGASSMVVIRRKERAEGWLLSSRSGNAEVSANFVDERGVVDVGMPRDGAQKSALRVIPNAMPTAFAQGNAPMLAQMPFEIAALHA